MITLVHVETETPRRMTEFHFDKGDLENESSGASFPELSVENRRKIFSQKNKET